MIIYQDNKQVFDEDIRKPDILIEALRLFFEYQSLLNALTSKSFSRDHFLESANSFYRTLEDTVATITDFSEKQDFLNTVYEKFSRVLR